MPRVKPDFLLASNPSCHSAKGVISWSGLLPRNGGPEMINSELEQIKKLWCERYTGTKHAFYSPIIFDELPDGQHIITISGPVKRKTLDKLKELAIKGYLPIEPTWRG